MMHSSESHSLISSLGFAARKVGPVILGFWIIGLGAVGLAVAWEQWHFPGHYFFAPLLSHLASGLIVGSLMVSVDKFVFFAEIKENMTEILRLHTLVTDTGVAAILPEDDRVYAGFGDIIRDAKELTVVVNYGKDWVLNWRTSLENRFLDPDKSTDYFLLDAESPFVATLAEKQGSAPVDTKKKITDTENDLINLYQTAKGQGKFRIYRIKSPFFPVVSVYLGENPGGKGRVIFSLYCASRHKGGVPLFDFNEIDAKRCIFKQICDDVHRLRDTHQAQYQFPNATGSATLNSAT